MKVCWTCGTDIDTEEGLNLCADCEQDRRRVDGALERRRARERDLRALGLTKVRDIMGGVFWKRLA